MSREQKSYSKLAAGFVVTCILGWAVTMAAIRTGAQWHPAAEQTAFAAWGTVVENDSGSYGGYGYHSAPCASKEDANRCPYQRVVFKTDEGKTFVIPFRVHDIEAVPHPVAAIDEDIPAEPATKEHAGQKIVGYSGGVCDPSCHYTDPQYQNYVMPATPAKAGYHKHVDAVVPHGILRYHLCDGSFYCFDSWEDK